MSKARARTINTSVFNEVARNVSERRRESKQNLSPSSDRMSHQFFNRLFCIG